MVEIKIERRRKPIWLWIFALLLIAIIIWVIYELASDRDEVQADAPPATGMVLPAAAEPVHFAKLNHIITKQRNGKL